MEEVTIRNYLDIVKAAESEIEPGTVRTATVEALVDTGATYLCLSPSVIRSLGLLPFETRKVMTANGTVEDASSGAPKSRSRAGRNICRSWKATRQLLHWLAMWCLKSWISLLIPSRRNHPQSSSQWRVGFRSLLGAGRLSPVAGLLRFRPTQEPLRHRGHSLSVLIPKPD